MQQLNFIPRRTFLLRTGALGTGALAATCSRLRNSRPSLGTLAYVDVATLWLRDLPDGKPRRVGAGDSLAWPRFSPSGRWIAFQDGNLGRVASTQPGPAQGAQWNVDEPGVSPLKWIGNRDDLGVQLADRQAGYPGDSLMIFNPSDHWRSSQRSLPLGLAFNSGHPGSDPGINRYAYSLTTTTGHRKDGSGTYKTALLLRSAGRQGEPKKLAETEGSFDIAGFTPSGEWILYWRSDEISASVQADGLPFLAVNTRSGKSFDPNITALVHEEMASISPAKDMVAVTAGSGRETWANKSIVLLDLQAGEMATRRLTDSSVAAQLPAWSPDAAKLAWCSGPDAGFLYKRTLLKQGQKTIAVMGPRAAEYRQIPITPELALGADQETIRRCVRLRRIYAAGLGKNEQPRQLTNDPAYSDEEPAWSADGSHILFCRVDAKNFRSLWLMRSDGSEVRQVAGPLRPPPGPADSAMFGFTTYYGHTSWQSMFDWRVT